MRKRTKDFEGCLECRARKLKCDKSRPGCKRCFRIGKTCSGYSFALIWVTPNHDFSHAQGRGGPCAYATWRGWPTLTVGEVNDLLTRLDDAPYDSDLFSNPAAGLFSVFDIRSMEVVSVSRNARKPLLLPILDPSGTTWDRNIRHLFHHYVNHVSPLMMPVHSSHNPWAIEYPRMALKNQCVRDALLGQAAAHLFHSGCNESRMKIHSLALRGTALRHLQHLLLDRGSGAFEIKIAAILSLIMADIYFGLSDGWTSHIFGAVEVAMNSAPESPWLVSEMAWLTAQSLSLLYLRARIDGSLNTARTNSVSHGLRLSNFILTPVSSRSDFGFTIGASQELAASLAEGAAIVEEANVQMLTAQLPSKVVHMTQRLLSMTLSVSELDSTAHATSTTSSLDMLHNHIFALGLIIRLQRSTNSPKPAELLNYTDLLFKGVELFRKVANANSNDPGHITSPTIWPVFHGAVELYRPADQAHARQIWLDELDKTAIGNRKHIQTVIEKTWQTRKERARLTSASLFSQSRSAIAEELSAGAIIVDWLEIAQDMGLDLLLV